MCSILRIVSAFLPQPVAFTPRLVFSGPSTCFWSKDILYNLLYRQFLLICLFFFNQGDLSWETSAEFPQSHWSGLRRLSMPWVLGRLKLPTSPASVVVLWRLGQQGGSVGREVSVGYATSCEDHSFLVYWLIEVEIPLDGAWTNGSLRMSGSF